MGRLNLQQKLLEIAPNAWFQKPPTNKMRYPCFVYKLVEPVTPRADDRIYFIMPRYEVVYITTSEDETINEEMAKRFPYLDIGRTYMSDNLYHHVFTINFK